MNNGYYLKEKSSGFSSSFSMSGGGASAAIVLRIQETAQQWRHQV